MGGLRNIEELFAGRKFDREMMMLCVRWYLPWRTKLRSSKYLNNLIEQGHRRIKPKTRPILGRRFSC
jgi:transposase-like protein